MPGRYFTCICNNILTKVRWSPSFKVLNMRRDYLNLIGGFTGSQCNNLR